MIWLSQLAFVIGRLPELVDETIDLVRVKRKLAERELRRPVSMENWPHINGPHGTEIKYDPFKKDF